MPDTVNVNDYKIGKGKLYIDLLDDNDNQTGERFMGNAPGFVLSVSTESIEHFSSTGGIREKDLEIPSQIDRTAQVTVDSLSKENAALFVIGDVNTVAQVGATVTDEEINGVQQGHWYSLGVSVSSPTGVRGISAVTVTDDSPSAPFTLNDDYELDLVRGRIRIVEGGAIVNGTNLLVDYTAATNSRKQVVTSTVARNARVLFIADNPQGENDDVLIPYATIKPSGDLQFIGEEVLSVTLDLGINKLTGFEAFYIDGQAA